MFSPDSWLEIVVRIPSLLIPVLILLSIGLIVGGVIATRRVRARIGALSDEAQNLRGDLAECVKHETERVSARETYLYFIHNVSHEVANPLQSIRTNLDNMAGCTLDEAQRWGQYHAIVLAEVGRLVRMTENLRALSRLETPGALVERESVNMMAVVQDVIMAMDHIAEARGVELKCVGSERPPRVLGNRDSLRQVLINLVDNGIKYSRKEDGRVIISVREEKDSLRIRVSDEGIGIPEEDLPYIFDTAYRALDAQSLRRRGSGLGLAIAKRIVEEHGGKLEVRSRLGEGTTFFIDLPLYFPPQ